MGVASAKVSPPVRTPGPGLPGDPPLTAGPRVLLYSGGTANEVPADSTSKTIPIKIVRMERPASRGVDARRVACPPYERDNQSTGEADRSPCQAPPATTRLRPAKRRPDGDGVIR